MVFGLALSIGAIILIGQQPTTLLQLLGSLGFFIFSFLILISVWKTYSRIMTVLPVETPFLVNLNITLLFLVSIEPYLFNELFVLNGDLWHAVSVLYSLDLAAMFLILGFFNHSITDEKKGLVTTQHLRKFRFERNYNLLLATVFILSNIPIFDSIVIVRIVDHDIPLKVILWIGVLIVGLASHLVAIIFKVS
jgi:uncharacterized membrane protein